MNPSRRGLLVRLALFAVAYGSCAWLYTYARGRSALVEDVQARQSSIDGERECEERLKELSWRLRAHRFANPSTPITSLEEMFRSEGMSEWRIRELLHCPCDRSDAESSYELVPVHNDDSSTSSALVEIRERSLNHDGHRNVTLFAVSRSEGR